MPVAEWLSDEALRLLSRSSDAHFDPVSSWNPHAPSPPLSHTIRKRSNSKRIATEMSGREPSPPKRRRLEDNEHASYAIEDTENTPKAKSHGAIEPPSPPSLTPSNRTTHSSRSHRSRSPKKKQTLRKMANLSLLPNPVVMKSIDDVTATPPEELEEIAQQLKSIGRGIRVISESEKVDQRVFFLHAKLTDVACSGFQVLGQIFPPDTQRRARIRR